MKYATDEEALERELLNHSSNYAAIMGNSEGEAKVFAHPSEGEREGYNDQVAYKGYIQEGGKVLPVMEVRYPYVRY